MALLVVCTPILLFGSARAGQAADDAASGDPLCAHTVTADIVAIEQAYLLNRFSAFVPAGMLFALRSDVVGLEPGSEPGPGNAMLRQDKRPRPLVLRVNEGDCLQVSFTNFLAPAASDEGGIPVQNGGRLPHQAEAVPGSAPGAGVDVAEPVSVDMPRTRAASFHITGLSVLRIEPGDCPLDAACGGDGSNVGLPERQGIVFNPGTAMTVQDRFRHGSLAMPGQTVVTKWRAGRDGAYFAYSMGAPVGGEGDGGQVGLGLFGSVNVEPAGSRWYRSQVTHDLLEATAGALRVTGHRYDHIDYEAMDGGVPVLNMLDAGGRIVHSDLNAIIVPPASASATENCGGRAFGTVCGQPFREFTVIFHDEVHAQQAFPQLEDENNPLHLIKDGMGINYGVSSMGSLMMATKQFGKGVGPAKDCAECRAEEFFLSSWANGDPALLLRYDADEAAGALYADDPSNVHHSYMGDNVRFRNLHAGPKETHVFHLHAHQWVPDPRDPNASYLDSQTISPGATFSYDIEFGGSGNRNYGPGDSIFHCHLYPHFAQGMWELWRTHDAFADGKPGLYDPDDPATDPGMMNLPDGEVAGGTETPALVPVPGAALAPMPTASFRGYPFYIPGEAGHRPPQPVLDFDVDQPWTDLTVAPPAEQVVDGGLPRHVVVEGSNERTPEAVEHARETGGEAARVIAARVAEQAPDALALLARDWTDLDIRTLREDGEPAEKVAMKFHEGTLVAPGLKPVQPPAPPNPAWWRPKAYESFRAATVSNQVPDTDPALFYVNGRPRAQGAPYAEPCPEEAPVRDYRTAFIQTELTYNKHGWFDPQGRIIVLENDIKDIIDPDKRTGLPAPLFFRANSGECIDFKSSNFVPAALNVDDFQVYTPTDTIGQHIHLVKFDVTSSDGSGNGWNYEDATFSPQEVRDRIFAYNAHLDAIHSPLKRLVPKAHPLFRPGGDIYEAAQADPARYGDLLARGQCPPPAAGQGMEDYADLLRREHDLCGAQRTTQRWWADPILNTTNGKDTTLRTVFTHDHMGPSSHQQHGLYAALVIEPANSVWGRVGAKLDQADMAVAAQTSCNGRPGDSDPRGLCGRLIGGSDIATPTAPALKAAVGSLLAPIEPRAPLKLRDDGGPTGTMANIFAPRCVGDSDSFDPGLQPSSGWNKPTGPGSCPADKLTHDTRREFDLAVADFGIAYNTALEPINPEPFDDNGLRDKSSIRFGTRHVFATPARPLAISSEDPGSQFFNYRHEPVALRIGEGTPDPLRGGWNYAQSRQRASLAGSCQPGDQDCLGDPANAFSTAVHAERDRLLATSAQQAIVTPSTRAIYRSLGMEARLDGVLGKAEAWRRNFNCALYSEALVPAAGNCDPSIVRAEPWRVFGDPATPILPTYEGDPVQLRLIQGAQEAQHVFTLNGLKWHRLPGSGDDDTNNSGFVSAQPIGISEHFEFDVRTAGLRSPVTDHLYFGSSGDQLWDGMWGLLRSYQLPDPDFPTVLRTSSDPKQAIDPGAFLAPIPSMAADEVGGETDDPCITDDPTKPLPGRFFAVSAIRACDLDQSCGEADQSGITYSERLGITDPSALVYLLEEKPKLCTSRDNCEGIGDALPENDAVLAKLRQDYADVPAIEPLVLHAAAGQCLFVSLRNLLPMRLDDGPRDMLDNPRPHTEARSSYNFLPMITDGFNINDFRMSSSVGLSPTGVFQNPLHSDGSNVGLNSAVLQMARDARPETPDPFASGPDTVQRQGSLVPPCLPGDDESRCRRIYHWSVTDFRGAGANRPVELGAVPLRSFGDVLKHPGHGLVGALVIGPEGSEVCQDDADSLPAGDGTSVAICRGDAPLYADRTVIVQDSVFASWGGLPVDNLSGAEEPDDYGVKALNFRTEPLWARTGGDPSLGFPERNEQDQADMLSSRNLGTDADPRCAAGVAPLATPGERAPCDPETPVFGATAGEPLRLHFVHPGGHTRQQGLALAGHAWNPYPWKDGSRVIDPAAGSSIRQGVFNGFGPMMATTMAVTAGGDAKQPLDFLFRSQASFIFDGGTWGILRVGPAANDE